MDKFNDQKLIDLARTSYVVRDDEKPNLEIQDLLAKTKLSDSERNILVNFVYSSRYNKPKSMTEMKREILTIIGHAKPGDYYSSYGQNTVNRAELEAIYQWIVKNTTEEKI